MDGILEILQEDSNQKDRFLTFTIDKEVFAVEISYVLEIIGIQPITPVPQTPSYVKGIINLRGNIIPVIDARLKFRRKEKVYDERTCIIILVVDGNSIGLIVDTVSEVITIVEENRARTPHTASSSDNEYIIAIGQLGDQVRLIISPDKMLKEWS